MNKNFFPNAITILNLLSGSLAIMFAFEHKLLLASIMIFLGSVFDFFDGLVARVLKVNNPIGKDLDSLADIVTFALAPAYILMQVFGNNFFRYSVFLLIGSAALRLANFNNDPKQKFIFRGLPTPASAIYFIGLVWLINKGYSWAGNKWFLLVNVVVFSVLMVSNVPMMSLKFKHLDDLLKDKIRLVFLFFSAVALIVLGIAGFSVVIVLYIIFSLMFYTGATINLHK